MRTLRHIALAALMIAPSVARPDVTEADIATCYRAPDTECLGTLGFELAMNATSYPKVVSEVHLLGQIGWYDEARALSIHSQVLSGKSEERAASFSDFILRDYEIMAEVLAGRPPRNDLGTNAITAAMRLLDQIMTDASLNMRVTEDPERLAAVRVLAEPMISGSRSDQIMAANLLTVTGDHDRARAILNTLKDDDSRPSNFSKDMIRLIGPEKTLEIYRSMEGASPWWYYDLVEVETDPARQLAYLEEMLAFAKDTYEGERLHSRLSSVVVEAMEVGQDQMARDVIEDFRGLVWPNGSARSLLALLRAEHAIGASERRQRTTLKRAARAIKEGDFDLRLPMHAARLGDVGLSVRLFDLDRDADGQDWARLIRGYMPNQARNALLAIAQDRLSQADFAATLADVAAGLSQPSRTGEENDWARHVAWQLLEDIPPLEKHGYLYDNILESAEHLKDFALIEAALLQSARRALEIQDYRMLLQAAYQHHHMAQFYPN